MLEGAPSTQEGPAATDGLGPEPGAVSEVPSVEVPLPAEFTETAAAEEEGEESEADAATVGDETVIPDVD